MCNLNCILVPWAVSNLTNIMGLKGFKTMCKKYNDFTNLTSIKKWRFSKKGNEKKDSWCHREWKKFASFLNNLFFTLFLALETIWQFSCNHGFRSAADACLANGIYLCALHTPTYYEADTVLYTTFPILLIRSPLVMLISTEKEEEEEEEEEEDSRFQKAVTTLTFPTNPDSLLISAIDRCFTMWGKWK